jgi:hypothetical protein
MSSRFIKPVGSWWFTVTLLMLLSASYMYFTFGADPYERWITLVFHTPAGLILYIGLIASLIFSSVLVAYKRLNRGNISYEDIRQMDTHIEIPAAESHSLERITEWLKQKGFSVVFHGEGVQSVRGRFSFLPGTVLRTGFIILLVSFLFSVHLRESEEMLLHEGETGVFFGNKILLSTITPELPEKFMQIGEKTRFRLDDMSAELTSSGNTYSLTPGFPVRIEKLYYRITHLGFSVPFNAETSMGDFGKNVDLEILPPGKTDIVELPSVDMFLTIALMPEKTIKKGLITGKQYNLRRPLYRVVLQKGEDKDKPESVTVRPGERVTSGGDTILLGENSFFLKINSVDDPALFWIYLGSLLTLSGMVCMFSRFFWYEKQIAAVLRDNVIFIGYSEEFYKKWGILKFHRWCEELFSDTEPSVDESQTTNRQEQAANQCP